MKIFKKEKFAARKFPSLGKISVSYRIISFFPKSKRNDSMDGRNFADAQTIMYSGEWIILILRLWVRIPIEHNFFSMLVIKFVLFK